MRALGSQLAVDRVSPGTPELVFSESEIVIPFRDSFWCTIRDTWWTAYAVASYSLDLAGAAKAAAFDCRVSNFHCGTPMARKPVRTAYAVVLVDRIEPAARRG